LAVIRYREREYAISPGETVLDALLRGGAEISYSCRTGSCQTCALRTADAQVPEHAQGQLRPTLRAQGYFLACQWRPRTDLTLLSADQDALYSPAIVTQVERLPGHICRVRLHTSMPLYYHAGQFVNVMRADGVSRSYSLASLPHEDELLELQVKRLQNGQMSQWIHDGLEVGERLSIQGPFGHCFYLPEPKARPLLLLGNGTGAAPLWGIARDALRAGHAAPIHFYHGARAAEGLYLDRELRQMAARYPQFHYHPCVSGADCPSHARASRADVAAFGDIGDMTGMRLYVCGLPDMVKKARRTAYLAGAALEDIHADPFEMKDLRQVSRDPGAERAAR
jgi:NAD(P)H-flavin reductase